MRGLGRSTPFCSSAALDVYKRQVAGAPLWPEAESATRWMLTETSSKATSRGASGLCTVTSAATTRGKDRTRSANRSARDSMRLNGLPYICLLYTSSEPTRPYSNSYAVFCMKKKNKKQKNTKETKKKIKSIQKLT